LYLRKGDYLPRAFQEPPIAYDDRVDRAVFNNKFRGQIESISGLLTSFEVEDLPASFEQANEDGLGLNGTGADFKGFFRHADELALRDGGCYILTNNVRLSLDEAADRTAADPRTYPQWTLIDRRNVLNWRTEVRQGRVTLAQVTIQAYQEEPDGAYGTKKQAYYHTFRLMPEGVSLSVSRLSDRGEAVPVQEMTAPIERIPLIAYPDISAPFPSDLDPQLPFLLKAAELNIKLFRQESNLDTIQYRVNAPTVYRVSDLPFDQRPPIVFGPNHVIELSRNPEGGSADEVGVVEIGGSGIQSLQTSIEQTKREIDEEGVGFLGGGTVERSATEAWLSATRASASLNGFARTKAQAILSLIRDWCLFTSEDSSGAQVVQDESLLTQPLDAQEMGSLLNLWSQGAIDHRTLLELLKMGKQLPPNTDVEEIMERVQAEKANAMPTPLAISNGILIEEQANASDEREAKNNAQAETSNDAEEA
jgi:hypothetical protein